MNKEICREFLYLDENVKYTISKEDEQLTIQSQHPFFTKHFGGSSVTKKLEDFNNISHKGSEDYDFFQKLNLSLQEYYLTVGV